MRPSRSNCLREFDLQNKRRKWERLVFPQCLFLSGEDEVVIIEPNKFYVNVSGNCMSFAWTQGGGGIKMVAAIAQGEKKRVRRH